VSRPCSVERDTHMTDWMLLGCAARYPLPDEALTKRTKAGHVDFVG